MQTPWEYRYAHRIKSMGSSVNAALVAPLVAGQSSRDVYLPAGEWFDFWSGKKIGGKQKIRVSPPMEQIPLYVKSGTLLPLAEVTAHTDDPASRRLRVRVYGNGSAGATLYGDDGQSATTLSWDGAGHVSGSGYEILGWDHTS